jgi:N-acetylmuramoyl-L-alanine amidase
LKTLALILGLLGCLAAAEAKPLVLLDPGHGGEDKGARAGGAAESELALALAKDLAASLARLGVETRLTRDGDRSLSLSARVDLANQLKPDALVSLHLNASFQKDASGARIFVPAEGSVDDRDAPRWEEAARVRAKESRSLGQALAQALGLRGGRPVQTLSLGLFRGLIVPVAVIETGFASDAGDLGQLQDETRRKALAQRLAEGIQAFLLSGVKHAAP